MWPHGTQDTGTVGKTAFFVLVFVFVFREFSCSVEVFKQNGTNGTSCLLVGTRSFWGLHKVTGLLSSPDLTANVQNSMTETG